MANPTVSVIIPTSGKNPLLKSCLLSLKKLNFTQAKIQTIVITNLDLKKKGKSFSFARAVNQAAKKAKGKYLLITNDDVVFNPNSLKSWIKSSSTHSPAILGASIRLPNNKPAPSGYNMSFWTGIAKPVLAQNQPISCNWVSGCAMFMEKKVFLKLESFDESFSPGFFEDADLCQRAKKIGISCQIIPNAKIIHHQTKTFNQNKNKKYEYWYRNKILFLRKHASLIQLASALFLQYALFTPVRAIILRDRRFLPALKGILWNLKVKS